MSMDRVLSCITWPTILMSLQLLSSQIEIASFENLQDDCGPDQFYHPVKSSCRNCTDINQTFQSYQEWLGREVSDIRRPNTDQESSPLNILQQSGPTRFAAQGEFLSRLINLDPQDQEDLDSSQEQTNNNDPYDLGGSRGGGGGDTIASETRQTQSVVDRFVQSNLIGNELLGAIEQCRQYQNISACQFWSNMCVMTMYSYSDSSSSSVASSSAALSAEYRQSIPGLNRRQQQAKRLIRTWQMCRQFNANSVCNSLREWLRLERKSNLDILNIYAADEPLAKVGHSVSRLNHAVQLLVYKYSYDGAFLGVSQFGTDEMEKFCLVSSEHLRSHLTDSNYIRVGKNMQLNCKFDPYQALKSPSRIKHFNETVFMDLYIGYPSNGAMFVKPVPILIKNLLHNGVQINRRHQKDPTRWRLVHRFFFHTIVDLDRADMVDQTLSTSQWQAEQVLLYTKSALLELKFKRQEKGVLLNTLLITLDYGQISLRDYETMIRSANNSLTINNNATTASTSTFTTTATVKLAQKLAATLESHIAINQNLSDMSSYKKDLDLTMTILGILSSIWVLIKCYNIQKCYGIVKLDLETLIRFLLIGCDIVANLFAAINLIFLSFLFAALKFQSTIQVLAPSDDLESTLIFSLQLALLFKLIGLAHKLYIMLNVDIFFVDWERPKMLTSAEILNHNNHYNDHHYTGKGSSQLESSSTAALSDNNQIEGNFRWSSSSQQTSFWRPYTIINRWLRMQTLRRHNTTLQLVLFVCLVDYSQVINLATSDPSLDLSWANSGNEPSNCKSQTNLCPYMSNTFRWLILSVVYFCLSLSQILFKKYFYEPLIRNRVHEFVDLCSVANVSLFCMLYPRYGYYIHGRNANGSGDCGIGEMNALLEREERDLCSKRGLAPNTDQQAFTLILPKIINEHYRKLLFRDYDHLLLATNGGDSNNFASGHLNKQPPLSLNVSRLKQNKTSNSLLRSALNLSIASSQSFSSNRTVIETTVAKNKAVNLFLTNFLEHIYKDIDYSIRDCRRFEGLLLGVDFDDENLIAGRRDLGPLSLATTGGGAGLNALGGIGGLDNQSAATFCKDPSDSFTSLLWLGLEFDLVFVELFSLLILDHWLGQPLVITSSLVLLLHHSFKALYVACARRNLVDKALIDQKFLFG